MRPFVALILGHGARCDRAGRPTHDPGAKTKALDTQGQPLTLIEEDRVRTLAPRLLARLAAEGIACGSYDAAIPSPDNDPLRSYTKRCAAAGREALRRGHHSALLLHLHFNAGGGRYVAAIHHPGEARTPGWAAALEASIATLPGVERRRGPSTVDDFPRASGLIQASWLAGSAQLAVHTIVMEPLFLDQPAHWRHLTDGGLDLLADSITAGLVAGLGAA